MIISKSYLCIDAGGTFFKFTAFDEKGNQLIPIGEIPANSNGTMEEIFAGYKQIFDLVNGDYKVCGVGIATPGPFDYVGKMSLMEHKFKSLYKVNLGDELEKIFGKIPITFMSDTNAFLKGAYDGKESSIGITIGTGLGIAISVDGELVTNKFGGPAEVIYNKSVDENHIAEDYVSGRGISAEYEILSGKSGFSAKEVSELARKGDEKALNVYNVMGTVLGDSLKDIVKKYDATVIFVGGQISKSLDLFEDNVQKKINKKVRIEAAPNSEMAALYGIYKEIKS